MRVSSDLCRAVICLLLSLLLDGWACGAAPAKDEKITLEKIYAVWKAREERTRTFQFAWTESRTYMKGSLPTFGNSSPVPQPTPPKDVTQERRLTLAVDRDLMRFTNVGPHWHPNEHRFFQRNYVSVFDGVDDKTYFGEGTDANPDEDVHKTGFVSKKQYNTDVVNYHLWPMLLTYRALHPAMGKFKPHEWKLTDEIGTVEGQKCSVLAKARDGVTESCLVDVMRDCSILRYSLISQTVGLQLTVSYRSDEANGWVPSAWKVVEWNPMMKRTDESTSAHVSGYTINAPLADDLFQFQFPPGTEVVDYKTKTSYLVLKNGEKRIITDEERWRGATYKEFLTTKSGEAGLPPTNPWLRWGWWVGVGVVLLIVARIIWKRRSPPRPSG